jgi:hypothetical protein
MERAKDLLEEHRRLQDETMRRLDAIANDIDAGRVPLEEGAKRADAYALEMQARMDSLLALRLEHLREANQRRRIFATVAIALLAGLAYIFFTHAGSAPG